MRVPVLAANWKMYKSLDETRAFFRDFAPLVASVTAAEIIVAPSFTALTTAVEAARGTRIEISGQDIHFERHGAFTGEVSAAMLKDAGASHVCFLPLRPDGIPMADERALEAFAPTQLKL